MADETKRVLLEIDVSADQFINTISKAKQNVAALKAENVKLRQDAEKALNSGLTQEYEQLNRAIIENENALKVGRTELNRATKQFETFTLASKANAGSYEELYQQWKLADVTLKNLEGTLKRNEDGTIQLTDEYIRAKKETDTAKTALLEFNKGIQDGRLNVGNYAQSIEGVLGRFPQFSGGLNVVKSGLFGVREGFNLVNAGFSAFGEAVSQFKSGVAQIPSAISQGFSRAGQTVTGFIDNIRGIKKESDGVAAVGAAGRTAATGLNTGVTAAKAFKLALASTGIGLLLVAVGGLVAFFTKTKEGAEKIQVAFSAIGGLVSSLIDSFAQFGKILIDTVSKPQQIFTDLTDYLKGTFLQSLIGIGKVLEGVFTLDFDRIKEGAGDVVGAFENAVEPVVNLRETLTDVYNRAGDVAKESAKITRETQLLRDEERKVQAELEGSKALIEAKIQQSKDLRLSEQERFKLIEEAGELEKKYSNELLSLAQRKYDLKVRENALTDSSAEDLDEEADLLREVNRLQAESAQLTAKVEVEKSNFIRAENAKRVANQIAALNLQLAQEEAAGQTSQQTRLEILRKQRDAELATLEEGSSEAIKVELKYQTDLLKLREEYAQKRQALLQQVQDINTARILDDRARELEQEAISLQRKLDAIKGNTEEENALREALIAQSADTIRDIQAKFDQQTLSKKTEALKRNYDEQLATIKQKEEEKFRELELQQSREIGLLRLKVQAGDATQEDIVAKEQEFAAARFAVQEQALLDEIALQQQSFSTRQVNAKTYYENELARLQEDLNNKLLTEEQFNAREAELDKQRLEQQSIAEVETKAETTELLNQLEDLRLQKVIQTEQGIVEQKIRSAQKQKEVDQLLYNQTRSALSGITELLSRDEKAKRKNAKALQAIASGEIIVNLYKEVSNIFLGASQDASKSFIVGGIASYVLAGVQAAISVAKAGAGLAAVKSQAFEHGGFTPNGVPMPFNEMVAKYNPVHAPNFTGGFVDRPTTFALTGERGVEFVANNKMVREAPALFRDMEIWRKTGVKPFADGGFTQGQFATVIDSAQNTQQTISAVLNNLPNPVVSVQEIIAVQNRVAVNENNASI